MPTPLLTRRALLTGGACALAAVAGPPGFLARAAGAAGARGKVLVAVFQRGAVDGLSMLVPHGDAAYYAARPTIALPRPRRGDTATALDLDGFFALHPALAPLRPLWDAGTLAFVPACGSPDVTRSHFDAQDYMESGTPGVKSTPDGWLGRAAGALPAESATPFRSVALGPRLPRVLRGGTGALALRSLDRFEVRTASPSTAGQRGFESLYRTGVQDLLHGTGRETFEAVRMLRSAGAARLAPANGAEYPRGRLGESLRQIAQLVRADVGLRVAFADVEGWDTHVAQGAEQGQLAGRLREFGAALAAFARDLGDRLADVLVLTMSEFGRTVAENGSRGTDHGHATAMLALGAGVRGGRTYGPWPGLVPEQRFESRDLALTVDFRHFFHEVTTRHLGLPPTTVLFPGWTPPDRALGIVG
jgi:uncharacterized protein (DUF1501 family)